MEAYQLLPNITRGLIWLYPAREKGLPAPPPPMVIEDIHTHIDIDEQSEQGGPGSTQWHTVGVVGIVETLLEPSLRWHSDSKRFRPGAQANTQNDKTIFW